jgi:hypothetical protein
MLGPFPNIQFQDLNTPHREYRECTDPLCLNVMGSHKEYLVILEGKAACCRHRKTPKNRCLGKVCPMARDKEVIPVVQHDL